MTKRKFSVNEVLGDLRSGLDNAGLRRKYELSENGLERLLDKLLELNVITKAELEQRKAMLDEQLDLKMLEDFDETDEFEKTIDLSDLGVVAAHELDDGPKPASKPASKPKPSPPPAPSSPPKSSAAPDSKRPFSPEKINEIAEFYESGGLKEMMEWWQKQKPEGAGGTSLITKGPRPLIGGNQGKQNASVTVDREILARAITKAKREGDQTGGTLSLLVELLLFKYIGSPDDLLIKPGQ